MRIYYNHNPIRTVKKILKENLLLIATACLTVFVGIVSYVGLSYHSYKLGLLSPLQTNKFAYMDEETLKSSILSSIPETFKVKTRKRKDVSMRTDKFLKADISVKRQSFKEYLLTPQLVVSIDWDVDWDFVTNRLLKMQHRGHNARIVKNNKGKFHIEDGEEAFIFSIPRAETMIYEALENHEYEVDISKLIKDGTVKAEDLQEKFEEVSWVNDWKIKYSDGTTLDSSTLNVGWYGYDFDPAKVDLSSVINSLTESYSLIGKTEKFKTTGNGIKEVKYVTYGNILDKASEEAQIRDLIDKHESQTDRVPVVIGQNGIGNTYVEVSLGSQHVWHYVDGKLCCESDCVSGRAGKHDTPQGVFYISEKVPGKYLTGQDYKTWVNRWMRLTNSGVGLHDADWRSSFGGSIYQSNGSHGCVNLPKDYAYALYDHVQTGLPVVIYD